MLLYRDVKDPEPKRYVYLDGKLRECLYQIKDVSFEECKILKDSFCRLYKRNRGNCFVKKLAKAGELNGFFSSSEIKDALEYGKLPDGYDIHHILPLNMGGTNDESNLCLIDRRLHIYLHKEILDQVRNNYEKDILTYLVLPQTGKIVTWNDAPLFFSQNEIDSILKKEIIREQKMAYRAQKKKIASLKKQNPNELNAAHRRAVRGEEKQLEQERRKQKSNEKQPSTYQNSDKYYRSKLKLNRNMVKRLFQKNPSWSPQYGD